MFKFIFKCLVKLPVSPQFAKRKADHLHNIVDHKWFVQHFRYTFPFACTIGIQDGPGWCEPEDGGIERCDYLALVVRSGLAVALRGTM